MLSGSTAVTDKVKGQAKNLQKIIKGQLILGGVTNSSGGEETELRVK